MSLSLHLLDPRVDAVRVAETWQALEAVAQPPYFLTWGWMQNWLACLPASQLPDLAVWREDQRDVATCFLGHQQLVRHHFFPSRALFLNATGVPSRDELCIEHNAILCVPGQRARALDLVSLVPGDWDELFLPAVDEGSFADLEQHDGRRNGTDRRYRVRLEKEVVAPFVDLEKVRAAPGGYLSLPGASTRAQIRRTERTLSPIELEAATDRVEAHAILRELIALHEKSWHARGELGAFSDPWFVRFHERLIDSRFERGEVQLLRIHGNGGTIGCLYNLVANGRVLFYQSGFTSFDDPRVKPGYLCHALAIEHAARAGYAVYDLLAGDRRYKHSLATGSVKLSWLRIQRPRVRFAIEDWLRRCKRAALGLTAQSF